MSAGSLASATGYQTGKPGSQHIPSQDVLGVVGCIPLVPGTLASKALLALFALARTPTVVDAQILLDAVQSSLRLIFTIFAIGTGMVIPVVAARWRATR